MGCRYAERVTQPNTTRPRGRPRRAPEHLRNLSLHVAVSRTEYEQLTVQAERSGQRLSAYIRRAALVGSPVVHELLGLLTRLLAQWRGLTANLNQASHRANIELVKQDGDPAVVRAEQAQIAGASAELAQLVAETRAAVTRFAARADASASSSTPSPPASPAASAEERIQ